MRNAHYWKEAGAKSAPSSILVFDTETWHGERATVSGGEWQTLRLGCAMHYRLEKGKRTRTSKITFRTSDQFWNFVRSKLDKSRPLWVFAHNIAYDLGVVSGWRIITGPEYLAEKAAVSGQIFWLKGEVESCGLNFCDTFNYYRCALSTIGKAFGLDKLDMPDQSESDSAWERYCWRDVEVTALAVDSLIGFTRQQCLGPWQASIAGLAFSAYRSRFMKHEVLVHSNRRVLEMERSAYYGGLVDVARVGKVPSDCVWELDVCSMYPAMCCYPLPYRFKDWTHNADVGTLRHLAKTFMLIADVIVETPEFPYPVKGKRGTYFPVGRFRTSLCHPELMHAVRCGHVAKVHKVAWYHHAPIFSDYIAFFMELKTLHDKPDTEALRTLDKYYLNNLYGKTGQLTPQWQQWGEAALTNLEDRYGLSPGTLEPHYCKPPDLHSPESVYNFLAIPEPIPIRNYYGVVEIQVGEAESRDSCPAIAATITSYARMLLRRFQEIAGPRNWFYCDTDSIWTNTNGFVNLWNAGVIRDAELGYLDVKKFHGELTVFGPKDYTTLTATRSKGIRPTARKTSDGGWEQLQFPSALQQIRLGSNGGVFVKSVVKHLKRTLTKCVVEPSGWTRPLVFPTEHPEADKKKG